MWNRISVECKHYTPDEQADSDSQDDDELTTQEQINEALSRLPQHQPGHSAVVCEHTDSDKQEAQKVEEFMSKGCGCQYFKRRPCSLQYSLDYVLTMRVNCTELSRKELNLVIIGQVMAFTNSSESLATGSNHREVTRQRSKLKYCHHGQLVCERIFRFLHAIGPSSVFVCVLCVT